MKYEYKKVTGYEQKKFVENGHTMFEEDVLLRLKRLAYLEEQQKQANGINMVGKLRDMYKTADNLEDLDFTEELNAYDSVFHAVDRSGFWGIDEKYKDSDFYIMMKDKSEEGEIKTLLNSCGFAAYLEYSDGECVRVG